MPVHCDLWVNWEECSSGKPSVVIQAQLGCVTNRILARGLESKRPNSISGVITVDPKEVHVKPTHKITYTDRSRKYTYRYAKRDPSYRDFDKTRNWAS